VFNRPATKPSPGHPARNVLEERKILHQESARYPRFLESYSHGEHVLNEGPIDCGELETVYDLDTEARYGSEGAKKIR
jgi:hypothetical protein